jgi:hypothetical protein
MRRPAHAVVVLPAHLWSLARRAQRMSCRPVHRSACLLLVLLVLLVLLLLLLLLS